MCRPPGIGMIELRQRSRGMTHSLCNGLTDVAGSTSSQCRCGNQETPRVMHVRRSSGQGRWPPARELAFGTLARRVPDVLRGKGKRDHARVPGFEIGRFERLPIRILPESRLEESVGDDNATGERVTYGVSSVRPGGGSSAAGLEGSITIH